MSDSYVASALLIAAATTYAIRVFPFLIFNAKHPAPKVLTYLGRVLSLGVVGMLIVYGIKDTSFNAPPYGLNEILAIVSVALLQWYLKIFVLSVLAGSAIYMWLVQSKVLVGVF
ncbi:branched-chain amino acid transporter permease [Helicobacter ailurogastricus]|uniref:branched-chain amino acid transporter permease n=1 Tax=Helicobacter ailurogastricus TaxID=1578720 RepID=UPI0022BAC31C|nr:AzlD domain-containing protein [Helicobacter ailurogastricus]GLH58185.1 Branched-chain amino acid transport protein AzlD [Helicobacter ailurogastricus]GLH59091.1 Branched-chain amino acid transport protein AzlD [Helicobacter ailurogastricus]